MSSLCEDCKCIAVEEESKGSFKPSLQSLRESGSSGCECCQFLIRCIESNTQFKLQAANIHDYGPVELRWWEDNEAEPGGANIRVGDSSKPLLKENLDFFTFRDSNAENKMCGGLYVCADPLSDTSIRLVNDWMGECVEKHPSCYVHSPTPPILPTRLVDVGPPDGSLEPKLRLSDKTTTPYATLSHCWGRVSRTTMTQENLKEMMVKIPISELSPNFRDAVSSARRLQIRYIWIDSLCIVQDSYDDWSRESAKMADIYKNSCLTIAATSAWDTDQGFLHIRERASDYCQLNESLGGLYLRKLLKDGADEILGSPLSRRAWTFQECQLSPRVLHFGVDQLVWQCRAKWHCESSAYGLNMMSNEFRSVYDGLDEVRQFSLESDPVTSKQMGLLKTQWYALVEAFSSKSLTYLSDKLPAISALAHEIQCATNDDYIAGLWKSDLLRGLLWHRVGRTNNEMQSRLPASRLQINCKVPSWSWAALDEPTLVDVWRLSTSAEAIATIVKVGTLLSREEFPLGQVYGGSLELSGPCTDIQIDKHVETEQDAILWRGGEYLKYPYWEKTIPLLPYSSELTATFDNDADSLRGGKYTCMGIIKHLGALRKGRGGARMVTRWGGVESTPAIFCLILSPMENSENKFRRVGMSVIGDGIDALDVIEHWETRTLIIE